MIERVVAERIVVTRHRLARDLAQARAFDRGGGAGEIALDEARLQPDRVENLRAAIGLIGRDAHLGHHLQNPLAACLHVILVKLLRLQRQLVADQDVLERLEREIRVDRLGAIARQHAEMMHLARFAGLDHQAGRGAQAFADQMMMYRRGREQRRDRNPRRRHFAVGDDEDVVLAAHRLGSLAAQPLERRLQPVPLFLGGPGGVERAGAEGVACGVGFRDRADLLQIDVAEDRLRHLEPVMGAGDMAEQVRPRPDHRHQRHHQLLADRVDRRVGDLREVLLEVVIEQLRLVREHGERRIGAHRADGIVALARHRLEEELHVLLGVAEGLLVVEQRGRVVAQAGLRRLGAFRQFLQLDLGLAQPFLVRMLDGERLLDLAVLDDAALLEVDQQHLAGLEPPFADDLLVRDRQHAGLRRHHHDIVVGEEIARRPQAVAVERGANLAAVGEGDRRRPVPRLHQRGVIFVERAPLRIHQRIARPCLGNQHHHRVDQRIAARHQQLERIVDAGRVRLAVRDQRPHLVEVAAEQFGMKRAAPRIHPIDVAAHGVDLAVMGEEAIGVRQPP